MGAWAPRASCVEAGGSPADFASAACAAARLPAQRWQTSVCTASGKRGRGKARTSSSSAPWLFGRQRLNARSNPLRTTRGAILGDGCGAVWVDSSRLRLPPGKACCEKDWSIWRPRTKMGARVETATMCTRGSSKWCARVGEGAGRGADYFLHVHVPSWYHGRCTCIPITRECRSL